MFGPQLPTYREVVTLPVGFKAPGSDDIVNEAEIRPVTGSDEYYIGLSTEYNRMPNDLVYKILLLSRCVVRIGNHKPVTVNDINKLHAMDVRALEYAVYRITYGEDALPDEDPNQPGG